MSGKPKLSRLPSRIHREWVHLLLEIVNYDPGGCLCGHGESCEVCLRSNDTRRAERRRKQVALKILRASGVRLRHSVPKYLMDRERYEIL